MSANSSFSDLPANFTSSVFTIVVSDRSFQIGWKSLISDGPDNFFTRHFIKSQARVIHIDRNADTFEYIIRHLRGYPIVAKDENQHQDLLNDAQYYGLKKLEKILTQFVFINVGGTTFRLKWDLFNKDGPHNYFTGPLKHSLLSPHPSLGESPPIVIERDPETFKDVIRHLQGYSIHIRDEEHRLKLLSDAKFYLLRKLRDKLCTAASEEHVENEILIRSEDIRPSLLRISENNGQVQYYQDKKLSCLMIQINDISATYHRNAMGDQFLLEGEDIKIIKDPQWTIANEFMFDKDCAIVMQDAKKGDIEQAFRLFDYLNSLTLEDQFWKPCQMHENCLMTWFGIERAISSLSIYPNTLTRLLMSVKKAQVVLSRTQANRKRDFIT